VAILTAVRWQPALHAGSAGMSDPPAKADARPPGRSRLEEPAHVAGEAVGLPLLVPGRRLSRDPRLLQTRQQKPAPGRRIDADPKQVANPVRVVLIESANAVRPARQPGIARQDDTRSRQVEACISLCLFYRQETNVAIVRPCGRPCCRCGRSLV